MIPSFQQVVTDPCEAEPSTAMNADVVICFLAGREKEMQSAGK